MKKSEQQPEKKKQENEMNSNKSMSFGDSIHSQEKQVSKINSQRDPN